MTWAVIASLVSALAVVTYAFWARGRDADRITNLVGDRLADGKALIDSERNGIALQQQRDTQKARADKAEAELADVRAQLVSTQAALAKADEENAENAADSVKNAPDPLRALGDVLSSSDRSNVSHTSDAGAGNGHQG